MNRLMTQLRRELWEAQGSFVRTPLWVALALTALLLLGALSSGAKIHGAMNELRGSAQEWEKFEGGASLIQALMRGDLFSSHPEVLGLALTAISVLFILVLLLVLQVYLLGCLHTDRRDRSILFWKSLPVSETRVVLTKLGFGLAVGPALFMLAALAVGILYVLFLLVFASVQLGVSPPGFGQVVMAFGGQLGGLVSGWLLFALWALPLMSWLLLCSALARKSPFLVALGLPLALMLVELWVLGSHSLWDSMVGQFHAAFRVLIDSLVSPGQLWGHWSATLSSASLWLGLVLTGGLLTATVWLRNYRYEI